MAILCTPNGGEVNIIQEMYHLSVVKYECFCSSSSSSSRPRLVMRELDSVKRIRFCFWPKNQASRSCRALMQTLCRVDCVRKSYSTRRSFSRAHTSPPTLTFDLDLPKFNNLVPVERGKGYDWRSLMTIGLELAPGSCSQTYLYIYRRRRKHNLPSLLVGKLWRLQCYRPWRFTLS